MSMIFRGRGVSDGLAMAEILVLGRARLHVPDGPAGEPEEELRRLERGLEQTRDRLQKLRTEAAEKLGEKEAEIFDAHLTVLEDEYSVVEPMRELIRTQGLSAPQAVERQFDELSEMFRSLGDALMAERAADTQDLKEQLLRALLGEEDGGACDLDRNVIVLAEELLPSDTVRMDLSHVVGLATHLGGATAHTAIIARTLGIPAVVGLEGLEEISSGTEAILDGGAGTLTVSPGEAEREAFRRSDAARQEEEQSLAAFRAMPTATADGKCFELFANIGSPGEVKAALEQGGEGVGLFRSEFLFMDRADLPGEEEQFEAYRQAVERMEGRPVIIRTLDVGGDKKLPALPLPQEENPFLGCRAVRMTLKRPDVFLPQLRSLLRAAAYGDLSVMFPMISGLEELRAAKAMLEQAREQLKAEGVPTGRVKVGIMVEIPAAALMAERLAREADFFSIGTNDLIQYTLAAERGNENVAGLYTAYHPAVLRLIAATARAAEAAGIPCGMCGEAAGDPLLTAALLGMGVGELSMSPRLIPRVRRLIGGLTLEQCRARARELLSQSDEGAVRTFLMSQENV